MIAATSIELPGMQLPGGSSALSVSPASPLFSSAPSSSTTPGQASQTFGDLLQAAVRSFSRAGAGNDRKNNSYHGGATSASFGNNIATLNSSIGNAVVGGRDLGGQIGTGKKQKSASDPGQNDPGQNDPALQIVVTSADPAALATVSAQVVLQQTSSSMLVDGPRQSTRSPIGGLSPAVASSQISSPLAPSFPVASFPGSSFKGWSPLAGAAATQLPAATGASTTILADAGAAPLQPNGNLLQAVAANGAAVVVPSAVPNIVPFTNTVPKTISAAARDAGPLAVADGQPNAASIPVADAVIPAVVGAVQNAVKRAVGIALPGTFMLAGRQSPSEIAAAQPTQNALDGAVTGPVAGAVTTAVPVQKTESVATSSVAAAVFQNIIKSAAGIAPPAPVVVFQPQPAQGVAAYAASQPVQNAAPVENVGAVLQTSPVQNANATVVADPFLQAAASTSANAIPVGFPYANAVYGNGKAEAKSVEGSLPVADTSSGMPRSTTAPQPGSPSDSLIGRPVAMDLAFPSAASTAQAAPVSAPKSPSVHLVAGPVPSDFPTSLPSARPTNHPVVDQANIQAVQQAINAPVTSSIGQMFGQMFEQAGIAAGNSVSAKPSLTSAFGSIAGLGASDGSKAGGKPATGFPAAGFKDKTFAAQVGSPSGSGSGTLDATSPGGQSQHTDAASQTPDASAAQLNQINPAAHAVAQMAVASAALPMGMNSNHNQTGNNQTGSNQPGNNQAVNNQTAIAAPETMSTINTAKLVQSMGQSEMRVGMHSTEFGNISIRTSATPDAISAQISLDHSELGRVLATHLPEMQASLGGSQAASVSIDMNGQAMNGQASGHGAGYGSAGNGSAGASGYGSGNGSGNGGGGSSAGSSSPGSSGSTTGSINGYQGGRTSERRSVSVTGRGLNSRLDIRV